MRHLIIILVLTAACHPGAPAADPDAGSPDGGAGSDAANGCAAGLAGAPCVLALYDQAATCSDPTALAQLATELTARAGMGPLWADGRALFATSAPLAVAGAFNAWSTTAAITAPLCGTGPIVVVTPVATGLRRTSSSMPAATGRSMPRTRRSRTTTSPATPTTATACSTRPTPASATSSLRPENARPTLGNCRDVTAYLPPGYDAPAAAALTYPVLFMHDGQNIWDDHTCCFGHTGWEVNVTLDSEIAAGKVAPVIVIGAANTANRNNEYGLDPTTTAAFMAFQIGTSPARCARRVRGDGERGRDRRQLARWPDRDAARPRAARCLSRHRVAIGSVLAGATSTAPTLVAQMPAMGKQPLAIYLDHGGEDSDNGDGAADTDEVRRPSSSRSAGKQTMSPNCAAPGASALCYYWEPGATHDELAWRARVWRMLEFMFPAH